MKNNILSYSNHDASKLSLMRQMLGSTILTTKCEHNCENHTVTLSSILLNDPKRSWLVGNVCLWNNLLENVCLLRSSLNRCHNGQGRVLVMTSDAKRMLPKVNQETSMYDYSRHSPHRSVSCSNLARNFATKDEL